MPQVTMRAIDAEGGQAIVTVGDEYFRVSVDFGWEPMLLRDETDARRAQRAGHYSVVSTVFGDVEAAIRAVRSAWLSTRGSKEQAQTSAEPIRRVLVAEDEHLVAMGLTSCLKDLGYEVCAIASDGDAAIAAATSTKPDIVTVDIRMPKKNGIEAAQVIWEELRVPSLVISAYSDEEFVSQATRVPGIFGYLLKPVGQDEMRLALRMAEGRRWRAGA